MPRKAFIAFLVCLPLETVVSGAQPDYFPLQVGNQWTYRASRLGDAFTVEVSDTAMAGDRSYFVVQGFPTGTVWLRMADDGTLYGYSPDTGKESVWAAFGAGEGVAYPTGIAPCNSTAMVRSRSAKVDIPIGHFDTALTIEYPPANCADAGLTGESYLPYVGLVRREQTSIAGPVVYDLMYARLNYGLTDLTAPEQTFTVGLGGTVFAPGAGATVRMTLRNTLPQPLSLTFPSGQRYDVAVRDDTGATVYQWSRGKLFTLLFGTLQLTGEKTWTATFPAPPQAGKYTVEAWLATSPVAWRGQVSIEVK